MKRIIIIFATIALSSFLNFVLADNSIPNQEYNSLRDGAISLIKENNLTDSINNRPHCVFYFYGCRGFGSWMIAVDNINFYTVYYTDSYKAAQEHQYKISYFTRDNAKIQMLFSFLKSSEKYIDRCFDNTYSPVAFYFSVCDNESHIFFEWDQRTRLVNTETKSPADVFMPICSSFIFPMLDFDGY